MKTYYEQFVLADCKRNDRGVLSLTANIEDEELREAIRCFVQWTVHEALNISDVNKNKSEFEREVCVTGHFMCENDDGTISRIAI